MNLKSLKKIIQRTTIGIIFTKPEIRTLGQNLFKQDIIISYLTFQLLVHNVHVKVQFEFVSVRMNHELRQPLLAPTSHSSPSTPFPRDRLVLDVASTHYYEKHNMMSTTVDRSVALITVSDRWSKTVRCASLPSRCNEACMREITV